MDSSKYKVIFFDLDGTLIPMDTDEFLNGYFTELGIFFAEKGFEDPKGMVKNVLAGTKVMMAPHEGKTNREVFWEFFENEIGYSAEEFEPVMEEFYTGRYNNVGKDKDPFPMALQALTILKDKGYRLFLTTMPLFPVVGVSERLKWIDIDFDLFERVTTYENSYNRKPSLEYYKENLAIAGVDPSEVLMVGNHTEEDMAILQLGCDGWLITDHLINENDFDMDTVPHGTFEEFMQFVKDLPQAKQ